MKTNPDEPAFPLADTVDGYEMWWESLKPGGVNYGLSKLEIFALAAMQGLCANPAILEAQHKAGCSPDSGWRNVAEAAVAQARATLAALEKEATKWAISQ